MKAGFSSLFMTRNRIPSQPMTGANTRIRSGVFGTPAQSFVDFVDASTASIYNYHEGDLFGPGAGNYVFEPNFELPLITIWGKGFIRNPNVFNPSQPPQIFSQPNVTSNGIGGLEAGQLMMQPLIIPGLTLEGGGT